VVVQRPSLKIGIHETYEQLVNLAIKYELYLFRQIIVVYDPFKEDTISPNFYNTRTSMLFYDLLPIFFRKTRLQLILFLFHICMYTCSLSLVNLV